MKARKIIALAAASAFAAAMLAGCTNGSDDNANVGGSTSAEAEGDASAAADTASGDTGSAAEKPQFEPLKVIYDEIKTEFNNDLDLSDYPLTASNVPADYEAVYEAEAGEFTGNTAAYDSPEASGGAEVNGVNSEGDSLTFVVDIEYDGFYDLNFVSKTSNGRRENYLFIDDEQVGTIMCLNYSGFGDSMMKNIYLTTGTHRITVKPYWGYVDYDCLKLTPNTTVNSDAYTVTAPLSNPNADENTRRLYKFLCDIYGKYSLTGQYADDGRTSTEYTRIAKETGSHFAVLGMDMMGYSLGSVANGGSSNTIEFAYDWYNNGGGIVTLCWHWHSPVDYQVNDSQNPWYSSFYKEASTLELDKIMNGEDEKGYELLMQDIDNISYQLERLRDAGVPVLWRPLHEASGGWFWWGDCQPESYIKLWNAMYDKMTNEHNLTNLIWVWNAQDAEWYPGDETVDIIATDIYAGKQVDSCYSGSFAQLVDVPSVPKLVALSENGCVMDPDKVMQGNSRWLYWGTWSDPFTLSNGILNDEYTTMETLNKAYNSDRTLTLEELPDLKNYPLD
ncbi:MAG: beta-mannosidase [Oscillospiraceae bacterium]|nr:beta-mannosidase [Oscillospiraceae bacterium]